MCKRSSRYRATVTRYRWGAGSLRSTWETGFSASCGAAKMQVDAAMLNAIAVVTLTQSTANRFISVLPFPSFVAFWIAQVLPHRRARVSANLDIHQEPMPQSGRCLCLESMKFPAKAQNCSNEITFSEFCERCGKFSNPALMWFEQPVGQAVPDAVYRSTLSCQAQPDLSYGLPRRITEMPQASRKHGTEFFRRRPTWFEHYWAKAAKVGTANTCFERPLKRFVGYAWGK